MNCPSCGHENRSGRKFCVSCGVALPRACPACGADCEAGENFCGDCGEPLAAAAPARPRADPPRPPAAAAGAGRAPVDTGSRKVVTIVFADLVGSTALHERVDAESARRLMERYYQALRGAVEDNGGTVVKLLGDGVMAAFGLHRVAEDDALRAVRGAAAMQEAFRELVRTESAALGAVGLRVAVNTGEVVVAAGEDDVVGDPVNVAARLQEQARDGDVVLGEATRRLVSTRVTLAPLGSVTLKGRAEAVAAHRLVSLDPPAGAVAAPFVGRDSELLRLEHLFDAAVTTPATRLAVLVGSPGLGKSRLIEEVSRRHGDRATILAAHCDAAGGATFAPLAHALRRFLGLADGTDGDAVRTAVAAALATDDDGNGGERARIADGVDGLLRGAAASPEETFFVVRRFLAALAAVRPVLLVIDDLHWGEPLLLDLVEHLVQWGGGVPLFVLVGARPELRDLRSSLVTPGGIVGDVITLGGLDAGAAMRLAAGVIGAADLPAAVAAKVLATSEGNPLFVGELVRMLVQEGALTRDGDRWTAGANLAVLEMPPTIHALLAARIERLRPEERTVLERAAVVGRHFSRGAVAALLGHVAGRGADDAGELDARLESLRRSELIERDSGWFLGEPALRFHHVLIRDAAYRRLLKGTRAELHAQLAGWIEGRASDAPEHDETIGRHLEQAHQLLGELGSLDAAAVALGERAARRLAAAGRRALARDDVSLAAGLLGRALALIGPEAPERADLVLDDCEALLAAGDVGLAAEAIAELDRIAGQAAGAKQPGETSGSANSTTAIPGAEAGRLRAWHTCFAGQLAVLTAPEALHAVAQQVGAAAAELAGLDDAAGEAKAHFVHAQALARLGRIGASEAALDHALAAARRAGDRRRANAVLAGAPLAALWGPSPVTRASGRCLDVVRVLRITQGAPAVEAVALSCQGVLEALRGRIDAARRMLASSRTMVEELGIVHRLHESDVFAGRVDLLVGDASAAERALRRGYEGLRDLGLGIDAARAAALLGRALLAQDRATEAETLSHESELLAGDDLQAAIAWRGVRAEALARRGDHAAAIALAEAAVAIAAATDALLDHADARLALAAALRAGGRRAEADAEERRAQELWEAKGATVLAERARRDGPPVAAVPSRPSLRAANRRFVPNRASEAILAVNAAMAEDIGRFRELLSEDYVETDRPTGVSYGRAAAIRSVEHLMRSTDALCHYEPLATLGETLGLYQRRVSASATGGKRFDVGAYENDAWAVLELDAHGLLCRQEVFADDRLSDALVRLYERYAESLPDGPARERAARAAESYAALMGTETDAERLLAALDPDFESVDHRHLSSWSLQGADAYLAHMRALREVADDIDFRLLDVVAIHPDAQLTRVLHTGTDRIGGGAYERPFFRLFVTGPGGRLVRAEWFDDDREVEALARFDALVAGGEPASALRRPVAPNLATASLDRFNAAVAARDLEALARDLAEDIEVVHHATGASYGRNGMLATWRSIFRAARLERQGQTLAALGNHHALGQHTMTLEGFVEEHLAAVGAIEADETVLFEVDDGGLIRRLDIFPTERLGAALAQMFERSAGRAPDPATAARAHGVAQFLLAFEGPMDADRIAAAYSASSIFVDRRLLGSWSAETNEDLKKHWRSQFAVADELTGRTDEILALTNDASLIRMTFPGTVRASGGRYENLFLALSLYDASGRAMHTELFDPEDRTTALARFDALVGNRGVPEDHAFANAATRAVDCFVRATGARDWQAVANLFSPHLRFDDRRPLLRMELGREGYLEQFRTLFDVPDSRWSYAVLATFGERLSLLRLVLRGSVADGGGDLEIEHLCLAVCDAEGLFETIVVFEPGQVDDARSELEAVYYAGEGKAWGPLRFFSEVVARRDWDAIAAMCAPGFVEHDHRSLALLGTSRDPGAWVNNFRVLVDLAPDTQVRFDHIRNSPHGILWALTWRGTRAGGAYEIPMVGVNEMDAEGRIVRVDFYDPEMVDQACARFAELAAPERTAEPFANAATRALERVARTTAVRDWEGLAALFAADLCFDDRRPLFRMKVPREEFLQQHRVLYDVPNARWAMSTLATCGERLSLSRITLHGDVAGGGGALEIDHVGVIEADDDGRIRGIVLFEPGDLEAATTALDDCWLTRGEIARSSHIARFATAAPRAMAERDWDGLAALFAPSLVVRDHRLVGFGELRGPEAFVAPLRMMAELAPDVASRSDHRRASGRAYLAEITRGGTRDGGAFESVFHWVVEFAEDGLARRIDCYDPHHLDAAQARFAEIGLAASRSGNGRAVAGHAVGPDPIAALIKPSLATAAMERWHAAYEAAFDTGDWSALHATLAPDCRFDDRRRMALLSGGGDLMVASLRERAASGAHFDWTVLGSFGERVVAGRMLWSGGPSDGRFEIEYLAVLEVDEAGLIIASVLFDVPDARAAQREAFARWPDVAPDHPLLSNNIKIQDAWNRMDLDGLGRLLAENLEVNDRRRTGTGRLQGREAYLRSVTALWELAPHSKLESGWVWLRCTPRGGVFASRRSGALPGGGEYTSDFLNVVFLEEELCLRLDLFEIDDAEAALARFAELSPGPTSPSPGSSARSHA